MSLNNRNIPHPAGPWNKVVLPVAALCRRWAGTGFIGVFILLFFSVSLWVTLRYLGIPVNYLTTSLGIGIGALVVILVLTVVQRSRALAERNALQQVVVAQEVSQREIALARDRMQQIMRVPDGPFQRPGIKLSHRMERATTISGDFYDVIRRVDGSVGVYLVDVEGHGLVAAQQAQMIHQHLSLLGASQSWGTGHPRQQLESADRSISELLVGEEVGFTMNFTEIDPTEMKVRHANAGMPYPLLFRRGVVVPEILHAAGTYVGLGYSRYPVKPEQAEVDASDGDVLVIFSDGIVEATDRQGRLFGQQGIQAAITSAGLESPERIADKILMAVKEHSG